MATNIMLKQSTSRATGATVHIGLQGYRGSRLAFRHIRVKRLP